MTAVAGTSRPAIRDSWLLVVCLARVFLFANFMVAASSITSLTGAWGIGYAEAGSISAGFLAGYAVSLLFFSVLADWIGARNSVLISAVTAAVTALAFGCFARSYEAALVLYTLAGAAQGGVYTPIIMVFADRYPAEYRGARIGWLIGSTSLGYALSLSLSAAMLYLADYRTAFIVTGIAPAIGAVFLIAAMLRVPNIRHTRPQTGRAGLQAWTDLRRNRRARWLLAGYTAHCWELIGMWSWMPTFLTANVVGAQRSTGSGSDGALIAVLLHLAGALAAASMGRLSDHWGRPRVLLVLGIAGAAFSFALGWTLTAPPLFVIAASLVYAFVTIGDSPVLSTALTEAVAPDILGRILALRSLLTQLVCPSFTVYAS